MKKTTARTISILSAVVVLILSQLACNISVDTGAATNTPEAIQPPAETLPPVATEAPTAAPPQAALTCNAATFTVDPGVAASTSAVIIPAPANPNDVPFWDLLPQYVKFSFNGYAQPNSAMEAIVDIFPVDGIKSVSAQLGQRVDDLKTILANKPTDPDNSIPYLPPANAAQMFHTRVHYLNFANGSGVAFISQMAQALVPINNNYLFYTFQGLTNDGKCYVAVTMPLSHPSLPAKDTMSSADYTNLQNNWDSYLSGIINSLGSQPANSFTPNLDLLDSMVASISVQ